MSETFDPNDLIRELSAALRFQRWNGAESVDRAWASPLPIVEQLAPARPAASLPVRSPAASASAVSPVPTAARTLPRVAERTLPPVASPSVSRPQPVVSTREQREEKLRALREEIGDCQRCAHAAGRQHIVHGTGNPMARLMIVGSQPGPGEDATGQPWQGEAGALLDKMLGAMGLRRSEVWLTTAVLCRPPQATVAQREARAACAPFLRRQFDVVRPEVVLAFGEPAARFLLRSQAPLAELRGKWESLLTAGLMATWSPEDMVRDAALKREAWADLQLVMGKLGLRRG